MIVSVVIATRDRRESLAATLSALSAVRTPSGLRAEIVVADNGSTTDTAELLAGTPSGGRGVRRVIEPRRGKSRALNAALRTVRSDLIAFLDDDVRPAPDWLERTVDALVTQRADVVAGEVRLAPKLVRDWMTTTHRAWLAETASAREGVGANLTIRREVLSRVPRFDPELGPGALGLWEDTLFLAQARAAGLRIGSAPGAVVHHHFDESRLSRAAWLRHAAAQGRSEAYVSWHWENAPDHRSLARELALRFRLAARRIRRRRSAPAPDWELDLLSGLAFEQQWRRERTRGRAYPRRDALKTGGQP
jgi:glycosyltransferase involved in cell wall biosynthesis